MRLIGTLLRGTVEDCHIRATSWGRTVPSWVWLSCPLRRSSRHQEFNHSLQRYGKSKISSLHTHESLSEFVLLRSELMTARSFWWPQHLCSTRPSTLVPISGPFLFLLVLLWRHKMLLRQLWLVAATILVSCYRLRICLKGMPKPIKKSLRLLKGNIRSSQHCSRPLFNASPKKDRILLGKTLTSIVGKQ